MIAEHAGELASLLTPVDLLGQSATFLTWAARLPAIAFAFCFGACVGSFLNVVIYRLPAGISIIAPPSRCPTCGARLTWKENIPIVGWLLLRGRCRYCGDRISPQYMIIELFMAVFFVGLTVLFFFVHPRVAYWGEVAGPWWYWNGLKSLPAFSAVLIMFAGLTAMTLIDARTFTIPLQIPLCLTIVAFLAWPVQVGVHAIWPLTAPTSQPWPIPLAEWELFWLALGGIIGITISLFLLRFGVFRYSFADYEDYLEKDEVLADYPHARREMLIELLFLLPCMVLMVGGYLIGRQWSGSPPLLLGAIGASLWGYLLAGGLVWAIRILGSLAFGKEAMGMGDVHLLAAVGAVVGWQDPIFIFVGAAFVGLAWVAVATLLRTLRLRVQHELPYGPHLAVATLLILLLHPVLYGSYGNYWGYISTAWSNFLQMLFP